MSDILNDFHSEFSSDYKKLEERLNSSNDPSIKTDIINLKRKVESVIHLLPKYQQLKYSDQLQSLIEKSNNVTKKPARRIRLNRDQLIQKEEIGHNKELNTSTTETKVDDIQLKKPTELETTVTINEIENEVIKITELSKTLNNVNNSIIITDDINSITLKSIKNSIIIINSKGPAFLFGLNNCLIFVKCHQLRIHDSKNSKFITEINSNLAIIENSKNLKFENVLKVKDFNCPMGKSGNYSTFEISEIPSDLKFKILQSLDISNLQEYLKFV